MTSLETLVARLVLGVAAGIAGVVLSSLPAIHRPGSAAFRRLANAAFLVSRLGGFALLFLVFRVAPRGDIPSFYLPEARSALSGKLPYRDFGSSYAPLHSFLDASLLRLWNSPLALILFAICVEFLLFYLWLRLGRALFAERDLRIAAVLYLTSAMSLQFVAVDGQDNVLIALLVLAALWLALRSRPLLSGAALALGAVAVKLLPIFFAPVLFLSVVRRWRWAAGFLTLAAAVYGSFAALRLPIQQPLEIEGALKSAGTLPFLVETVTGISFPVQFWDAVMLLGLGVLYLVLWRQATRVLASTPPPSPAAAASPILWGVPAATLLLLLLANKSWSPYLLLCLFPLCVAVARGGLLSRILFALFGVVALLEKSYWTSILGMDPAPALRAAVLHQNLRYIAFLPIELPLLLGYVWLLCLCLGQLLRLRPVPSPGIQPTGYCSTPTSAQAGELRS